MNETRRGANDSLFCFTAGILFLSAILLTDILLLTFFMVSAVSLLQSIRRYHSLLSARFKSFPYKQVNKHRQTDMSLSVLNYLRLVILDSAREARRRGANDTLFCAGNLFVSAVLLTDILLIFEGNINCAGRRK